MASPEKRLLQPDVGLLPQEGGYYVRSSPGVLSRLKAASIEFAVTAILIAGFILVALLTVDLMVHP
jgi:hypothetical protein